EAVFVHEIAGEQAVEHEAHVAHLGQHGHLPRVAVAAAVVGTAAEVEHTGSKAVFRQRLRVGLHVSQSAGKAVGEEDGGVGRAALVGKIQLCVNVEAVPGEKGKPANGV